MKVVPRGIGRLAVERPLRVVACLDERSVSPLHLNTRGLEHRPFVLTDEVHRQVFPLGAHLEANGPEGVTFALEVPERSGDRRFYRDRRNVVPSVQAAVGGQRRVE